MRWKKSIVLKGSCRYLKKWTEVLTTKKSSTPPTSHIAELCCVQEITFISTTQRQRIITLSLKSSLCTRVQETKFQITHTLVPDSLQTAEMFPIHLWTVLALFRGRGNPDPYLLVMSSVEELLGGGQAHYPKVHRLYHPWRCRIFFSYTFPRSPSRHTGNLLYVIY